MASCTIWRSRSRRWTRCCGPASTCAATTWRSTSRVAAAPACSLPSSSRTRTGITWKSTGASTRSAATARCVRRGVERCHQPGGGDRRSGGWAGHHGAGPFAAANVILLCHGRRRRAPGPICNTCALGQDLAAVTLDESCGTITLPKRVRRLRGLRRTRGSPRSEQRNDRAGRSSGLMSGGKVIDDGQPAIIRGRTRCLPTTWYRHRDHDQCHSHRLAWMKR